MKKEDVRIGMKVIPFQKTAYSNKLEESGAWERAITKGQKYLYVIDWDNKEECFVLDDENINTGGNGDFFNPEDFEPYEENEEIPLYPFGLHNDRNISDAFQYLKSKGVTPEIYEKLWKMEL